jgi:hypothetical protein
MTKTEILMRYVPFGLKVKSLEGQEQVKSIFSLNGTISESKWYLKTEDNKVQSVEDCIPCLRSVDYLLTVEGIKLFEKCLEVTMCNYELEIKNILATSKKFKDGKSYGVICNKGSYFIGYDCYRKGFFIGRYVSVPDRIGYYIPKRAMHSDQEELFSIMYQGKVNVHELECEELC